MASYTALFNGVDKSASNVLMDGFSIREVTNGINTLVCEVESVDASYRPLKRQTVDIYEDDGSSPVRKIFGGLIKMVRERGFGQPADGIDSIVMSVTADSYKTLAERRFVTAVIPAGTLKAALQVIEPYLTAYGVTLDPAQADGPTLEAMEFEVTRVDDALNFFAQLTTKYGAPFYWTISYDLLLGMYQSGTVPGPWNLIEGDGTEVGDVEVEPTDDEYANRIILVWGAGTVVAVEDDTFIGDGVTDTFELTLQLVGPGIPQTSTAVGWGYVTRATIFFETLGDLGTGAMWEYDPVANTIQRTIGAPALGEVITIDYHGESRGTVIAQDAGEIAANGIWEDKILAPEIDNAALAQDVADAELARRLATGRIVRFRTRRVPCVVPGETITITVPKRNISGSFLVTDVATDNEPGAALDDVSPSDENNLIRTVTCASNIHEQEHQTLTRWWSEKDTNGIATPTGSGAVPGPPPYSAQWNDSTSGRALFGGAYHILYYDLFYSQPNSGETKSKGWLFVQNQNMGADGHIGITDPQRLEMGMVGNGTFSMDLFSVEEGSPPQMIPATILINSIGNIVLTAGTPVTDLNWGAIALVGAQNIDKTISIVGPGGPEPGVSTIPGIFAQSFSRFADHNVLDSISGTYRTVNSLPFSIQVTGNETEHEFLVYVVTAGTGTIFLPWIGTAGVPNYRSFPVTSVGRQYYIINDGGGTLTVDAGTACTNINDASTITLADKAAVHVERHDDGWRILSSFGSVTGGGSGSGATPGGAVKDVQFHNPAGVFDGNANFTYDETIGQVKIIHADDYAVLKLETPTTPADAGGPIEFRVDSGVNYSEMLIGIDYANGAYTAIQPNPGYFWHQGNGNDSPGLTAIGAELVIDETPTSPVSYDKTRGFNINDAGVFQVYQSGGMGSGSPSSAGCGVTIERNDDGDGAAGFLGLENKDGTFRYLWSDQQHIPRWGEAPPSEDGSPSTADTDALRLSPEIIVIAEADDQDTDNTAHNDPELFTDVEADSVYLFQACLFFNTGTSNTPDAKFNFTYPALAVLTFGGTGLLPTATTSQQFNMIGHYQVASPTVEQPVGVLTTASLLTSPVQIHGVLRVGATAGTLQLQWAQNTTTGGTPTVRRADSYIRLVKTR